MKDSHSIALIDLYKVCLCIKCFLKKGETKIFKYMRGIVCSFYEFVYRETRKNMFEICFVF